MLQGKLLKSATASSNVAPAPVVSSIVSWSAVNSAKFGYYIRFHLSNGGHTDRVLPGSYADMKALAPSLKAGDLLKYPLPTPKVVKW
jgi:hypothetical protein